MTLVDRAQVLEDPNLFALTNSTRDEESDEEWSKSAGVAAAAATVYQAWGNTQPLDVPLLSAVMYGVDQVQV